MNRLQFSILSGLLLYPCLLLALPDDLEQDLLTSCPARSESFLDQGLEICRGTSEQPAEISQGSLKLSGMEITIERVEGTVRQVTATGAPATFQQQPALDQEIVYANGERIVFNGSEQIITIEGEASFTQEGTIDTTAARIEYDIPNRKLDATQMNMVIPSQSQP
tara:strand:+ start:455476 stop:455970 length:495 start_codon:yes stop_codon:yes gene_type:complete